MHQNENPSMAEIIDVTSLLIYTLKKANIVTSLDHESQQTCTNLNPIKSVETTGVIYEDLTLHCPDTLLPLVPGGGGLRSERPVGAATMRPRWAACWGKRGVGLYGPEWLTIKIKCPPHNPVETRTWQLTH